MRSLREQITPLGLITGAGLILGLPCLLFGFPFYGDDSITHAVSYSHFAEQLWQGDPYPRWLPQMNSGLGSAYFFFYSPLPHYLTSVLRPLFTNDQNGWTQLGIGACAAVIVSGFTFYLWIKNHAARKTALLSAVVYMALPYHVNIDLYTRGAYAELWAFACMPLLLLACDEIQGNRRLGFIWVSLSFGLLVLTSLPTALIFSPVVLIYPFVCFTREGRLKSLVILVLGMLYGTALSAGYLMPAIALKRFTFLSEGISGHYFYSNWFLFTGLNWSSVRSDIFWFSIEVLALAILAFLTRSRREHANRAQPRFWLVVALASFLLMTPLSKPVWGLLPLLREVQFPWRFNTILSLAAAALVGLSLTWDRQRLVRSLVLFVPMVGLLGLWLYDLGPRAWYSYRENYVDATVVRERERWLEQRRDQNEYRPRWVVSIHELNLDQLVDRLGTVTGASLEGNGSILIERWDRKGIVFLVDSAEPDVVRLTQFYFPGWEATNGGNRPLNVRPSIPDGLVSIDVPAGKQRVLLRRVFTNPELIGMGITGVALIVWAVVLFYSYKLRKRQLTTFSPVN